MDDTIQFYGVAINNDLRLLSQYGIQITSAIDLQRAILNPTNNLLPSLYALANSTIGTELEKKNKKKDKKKKGNTDDEEEDL